MKKLAMIPGIVPAPIAAKATKSVYEIEDCVILENNVLVEYHVNDIQRMANIELATLKQFVQSTGMNEYCFDYSVNGSHVQDCGALDVDTFLSENLNEAVRALIEATSFEALAERRAA